MSDKIKYKSKYTDKEVSPAQIITEKICEAVARKNKEILPIRFWELEKYKKIFKRQIITANSLLKVFSVEAILKALSDPQMKWCYSLSAPFLLPIIKKYQNEREIEITKVIEPSNTMDKPRPVISEKKTIFDLL